MQLCRFWAIITFHSLIIQTTATLSSKDRPTLAYQYLVFSIWYKTLLKLLLAKFGITRTLALCSRDSGESRSFMSVTVASTPQKDGCGYMIIGISLRTLLFRSTLSAVPTYQPLYETTSVAWTKQKENIEWRTYARRNVYYTSCSYLFSVFQPAFIHRSIEYSRAATQLEKKIDGKAKNKLSNVRSLWYLNWVAAVHILV